MTTSFSPLASIEPLLISSRRAVNTRASTWASHVACMREANACVKLTISNFCWSLHDCVPRTSTAFGHTPLNVLCWIFNITSLHQLKIMRVWFFHKCYDIQWMNKKTRILKQQRTHTRRRTIWLNYNLTCYYVVHVSYFVGSKSWKPCFILSLGNMVGYWSAQLQRGELMLNYNYCT